MRCQSIILFVLFLFTQHFCFAQELSRDFSKADSIARSADIRTKNISKLAQQLTSSLDTEADKARAIFTWVVDHIAYDVKLYHNNKKRLKLAKKSNRQLIRRTIRKKKAICSGYSELFRMLAFSAGLETQTVSGYSKTKRTDIGGRLRANHAWNLVKINGRWEYVDTTWGSGHTDKWVTKFQREFKDRYFMTERSKFEMDHKAANGYWFEDEDKVSNKEFRDFPIIGTQYFSDGLEFESGSKLGLREVSEGDTLRLKLRWNKHIARASVLPSYSEKKNGNHIYEDVSIQRDKSTYALDYVIKRTGRFYLTYFVNGKHLATFRIESANRKN